MAVSRSLNTGRGDGGVDQDIRKRMVELLPRLRRFSLVLARDLDKADDLVQETCIRALASADQWQPGTRLDSWMYRIAQNLWLDRMRANKVRGVSVEIDTVHELAGADGRDITEARLTLQTVSENMRMLSAEQQLLITLVGIDGLSYKEVAESLDIPIGTVMSRLARARRVLHASLEADEGPREPGLNPGRTKETAR